MEGYEYPIFLSKPRVILKPPLRSAMPLSVARIYVGIPLVAMKVKTPRSARERWPTACRESGCSIAHGAVALFAMRLFSTFLVLLSHVAHGPLKKNEPPNWLLILYFQYSGQTPIISTMLYKNVSWKYFKYRRW